MKLKKISIAALFMITLCLPLSSRAENDPRDSINAPGGTNILLFYYRHYFGDEMYANGGKAANDIDYDFNMAIFRYARFVDIGDWNWSFDFLQPIGDLDLADFHSSGLGDTNAATHINTPYLYQTDTMKYMMSAGFYLSAPTGDYDSDKAVNLGCSRWTFKFEYTPVILQMGDWALELTGDVKFFTDNDDYGSSSADLKTDPLFGFQTHLSYNITDSFWVGASYYLFSGGENEIDGVDQDDEPENQALRFSASYNLAPNVIMMLQYETEIERDNGVKQDYVGTRIAYVW